MRILLAALIAWLPCQAQNHEDGENPPPPAIAGAGAFPDYSRLVAAQNVYERADLGDRSAQMALVTATIDRARQARAIGVMEIGSDVLVTDHTGASSVVKVTSINRDARSFVATDAAGTSATWSFDQVAGDASFWDKTKKVMLENPVGRAVTYIGGALASIALGVFVKEEIDVGKTNKGEADALAAAAAAQAQADNAAAAAYQQGQADAIRQGADTAYTFEINGTFSSAPVQSEYGQWTPTITFGGSGADFKSGRVVSYVVPPTANGPQTEQMATQGRWVLLPSKSELPVGVIGISGTYDYYSGEAGVSANGLVIGGRSYTGGSIVPHYARAGAELTEAP